MDICLKNTKASIVYPLMIKNNIKIAWRSLLKNRSYSVINITGLAVGLAAVLLISLWIQNQIKYDNFYPDKDQIYKVWHRTVYQGDINVHAGPS